jgi:hypothetical protein
MARVIPYDAWHVSCRLTGDMLRMFTGAACSADLALLMDEADISIDQPLGTPLPTCQLPLRNCTKVASRSTSHSSQIRISF